MNSLLLSALLAFVPGETGFALGVAAGDVTDDSAILWTRADEPGAIRWQLARNEAFTDIDQQGVATAATENDLTVIVPVTGLASQQDYWYRFLRDDTPQEASTIGRFRTPPAPDQPAAFRFAISGDSNYLDQPFRVLSYAADEDLDFFLYIGDIIYGDLGVVATTLDEYRQKYRENWLDPNLQKLLASTAVWATWDDHEVENDYNALELLAEGRGDQITAAYQAFFEYLPLRRFAKDPWRIYRSFRYGTTAEFFLLDGRQYRQPSAADACGGNLDPFGMVVGEPDNACVLDLSAPRTMLGVEQLAWLKNGLLNSPAAAKFVVTDVPIGFFGILPYDRWDGYDAERRELLEFIDAHNITNVWFLTTDMHNNAFRPDVMEYFHRYRPDYQLPNGVRCPEVITGPVATATLYDELVINAAPWVGLDPNDPLTDLLLRPVVANVLHGIQQIGGVTFVAPDYFAYTVFDVDAAGHVSLAIRGVPADAATAAPLETLHTEPPPPLPCSLPVFAALGVSAAAAVSWNRSHPHGARLA